jgi:hypothetical protein
LHLQAVVDAAAAATAPGAAKDVTVVAATQVAPANKSKKKTKLLFEFTDSKSGRQYVYDPVTGDSRCPVDE